MTKIVDGLKEIAKFTVTIPIIATGVVIGMAVAPLVSLVAVPLFALKALPRWIEHRSLYNRTLTHGSRAKFGRIEGQDYTRWDGKAMAQMNTPPTWQERMHELIGEDIHGQKDVSFETDPNKQAADNPFQTQDDLDWLKREFIRREKKDLLDSDLKMVRAFSKALIPIAGVIWVLSSELRVGGACQLECPVCATGDSSEDTHWEWERAIRFHQKFLSDKLSKS